MALLFADEGAYLVTDGEIKKSVTAIEGDRYLTGIGESNVTESLVKSQLMGEYDVSILTDRDSASPAADTFNYSATLAVPSVYQGVDTKTCWACCVLSICGYYNISTTLDDIYARAGVEFGRGGDLTTAEVALESYGRLTTKRPGSLSWYMLRTEIYYRSCPLIASLQLISGDVSLGGHAVVVCGYYVYQNISDHIGQLICMDPYSGTLVATNVDTDGEYTYVYPGASTTYDVTGFLVVA